MDGQSSEMKICYGEENLKSILEEIIKQEFMKIFKQEE